MAQLVVSAAAAAVGFAIAGPTGAQAGWVAGSILGGSLFAPEQKAQGPRLTDLTAGSAAYGVTIPYLIGHPRVAGNIVWASTKREIATTQSGGGKGGGGQQYTSYTYEIDLLILLSDNPIVGVRKVWSNGKLIWSAANDATVGSQVASAQTDKWTRLTTYTGSSSQQPDPTYQAAVGIANAPAYRGRGSVFIQSLQLGSGGQIPNLTFEVVTSGSVSSYRYGEGLLNHFDSIVGSAYPSAIGPDMAVGTSSLNTSSAKFGAGSLTGTSGTSLSPTFYLDNTRSWCADGWFKPVGLSGLYFSINQVSTQITLGWDSRFSDSAYSVGWLLVGGASGNGRYGPFAYAPVLGQWNHVRLQFDRRTAKFKIFVNGLNADGPGGYWPDSGLVTVGNCVSVNVFDGGDEFYLRFVDDDDLRNDAISVPSTPFSASNIYPLVVSITEVSVQSAVSALCLRAGLSAGQFDVSALASITTPVRAMANSQVSTVRNALETLASVYFFDAILSDKIYFRPRGSAPVTTINYSDLGFGVGEGSTDALILKKSNELEIPAQMALTYSNLDSDYQTDTQYSDRLLTGQESTSAAQVPLTLTAAEAKAITDAMLADKAAGSVSTSIDIPTDFCALEPTDVINVVGPDGSIYRTRILKKRESSGVLSMDLVLEDATVLTQAGTTSGGVTGQTVVAPTPTTLLQMLDIPALNNESTPGLYAAATGNSSDWVSAALYESADGSTYSQNQIIFEQSVTGYASTALNNWAGGFVFDEISTVTVMVNFGQLVSVTRDALLEDLTLNVALIGSEIVQFRNATLTATNTYRLSGFLRGLRGTELERSTHAIGDTFVMLTSGSLVFASLTPSQLNILRYYKAASSGQSLSAVNSKLITPTGANLKCFSGVNARANRNAADTVITWNRRTRFGTSLVGTANISAPLGEATESYSIDIFTNSSFTVVKRTLTSSTQSVTYTSANQIADFGAAQSVLYVKIYQLSATVGRGTALTATI